MSPRPRNTVDMLLDHTIRNESGCAVWQGATDGKAGYGIIIRVVDGVRRKKGVHVLMSELTDGPIPESVIVRHTCDTPPCIEPSHLLRGSHADNANDRVIRGRTARGERHGMARLNADDVNTIRSTPNKYGTGRELARRFGVAPSTISAIRCGDNWNSNIQGG